MLSGVRICRPSNLMSDKCHNWHGITCHSCPLRFQSGTSNSLCLTLICFIGMLEISHAARREEGSSSRCRCLCCLFFSSSMMNLTVLKSFPSVRDREDNGTLQEDPPILFLLRCRYPDHLRPRHTAIRRFHRHILPMFFTVVARKTHSS